MIVYLVQYATRQRETFSCGCDEGFAGVFGRQLPRPWTNKIERVFLDSTYLDAREVRVCPEQRAFGIRDIFFSNVCYAIRRDVWERIPFDESLIMSEDQLWAKQVLLASHQLLCEPSAQVFHLHNYGLRDFFRRNFDSGASLVGIAQDTFANMVSYEGRHAVWCASEVAPSSFDYQHGIRGGITTHKVSRTQLHQWLPVAGGFFKPGFLLSSPAVCQRECERGVKNSHDRIPDGL